MPFDPTNDDQLPMSTDSTTTDTQPDPQIIPDPQQPQAQQTQQPVQASAQQPQTQAQPSQGQPMVTNAAPANSQQQPSDSNDPAIQHASRFYKFASALAGGPRTRTIIDPTTGVATRQTIPLSRGDIGMAIALEALSGGITGLAQSGPGATGRAAAAGFQTVMQQQQQARQAQEQQAQTDYQNEYTALSRKAQAFEANSRTILNTAQAERYGVESLKDNVAQNEKLLSDYDDAGAVQERNVSQDSLAAGMASGAYNSVSQIAVPDGYTNINGKWEQTFSVIQNPSAKIPLTNEQAQALGDSYVPGFLPYRDGKTKLPDGFSITGSVLASANSQAVANRLMLQDSATVSNTLSKSDDPANQKLAEQIPDFRSLLADPERGAGLQAALSRFQKYVSHSDQHGMSFTQSLQAMASPSKADPTNPKVMVPNRDAPFAQTIAGAFGNGDPAKGWDILQRYHEEIEPEQIANSAQASDMLASSAPGSRAYRYAQAWINADVQQKALATAAEERAKQSVGGGGTGTASGQSSQDVQQAAAAIANGTGTFEQLTSGMGKEASAFRRQVESVLLKNYPGVNIAALKAYSKAADSQAVQSQLTNGRSLFGSNGQPGSFDALEDAIRAVPKAPIPFLSKLGQKTAYNIGSPQMATLLAIKTDIASDLAKFNTGGGSHSSDHQVELYREQLNEAQTPEQVERVLGDIREISSKRLAGLVGTNPYLQNMAKDINDPVTKAPLSGNTGGSAGSNTRSSQPSTSSPRPPAGATMRVPGSDGKLHWSDGRRDLGVIQ